MVFWLVEELLDSQTIDGCKIVFDYLDSRRDILTAVSVLHAVCAHAPNLVQKHFKQKHLIILRACNELLRRLSRAEDTVFCGRVFIFLFQSFPLGDRSSVNLRGEYHVENVTKYENLSRNGQSLTNGDMDVDKKEYQETIPTTTGEKTEAPSNVEPNGSTPSAPADLTSVKKNFEKVAHERAEPDMDTLYSMFWSLQDFFSQPLKLFDDENLKMFKLGLEVTIQKFKKVHEAQQARGNNRISLESKSGEKRKRNDDEDELASSFNPKYLTSRDLFDLEVRDLAFRRHILVQALILIDFLLSLTPRAKKKLESMSNKSVLYAYNFNEENAKWATETRNDIANYLQEGPEGKFYFRMVDTVLSRDKNWSLWKAEGCPLISRDPISAGDYAEAEKSAQKTSANKRIRPAPMGALDLKFLAHDRTTGGMTQLEDPVRYTVPTIDSFKAPIIQDDFEIEMAKDDEEKQLSIDARASKLWRTLRVASKSRLNIFDKIDDGNDLKPLFDPEPEQENDKVDVNAEEDHGKTVLLQTEGDPDEARNEDDAMLQEVAVT